MKRHMPTKTANQNDSRSRGIYQGMNWIRQEKRLAIYLRDGLACVYCGDSAEKGATLTLDHLTCHSNGGSNHESNLVTACMRCNSSRGTRSVRGFCKAVAAYVNHDITAESIEAHVRRCARRVLNVSEAKRLMERRGSAAAVLSSFQKELGHV